MPYEQYLPVQLGDLRGQIYRALCWGDDDEFERQFGQQLYFVGHPAQQFPLTVESTAWFDPEEPSHLDQVWQWFVLGILLEPYIGCLQFAEDDEERALTRQCALWIYSHVDPNSQPGPPPDVVPEDWLPIYDELSLSKLARLAVAMFEPDKNENCGDFFVEGAAMLHEEAPVPMPKGFLAREEAIGMKLLNGSLNLAGLFIPWLDLTKPGSLAHYYHQAEWMLDLLCLPWKPDCDAERELLNAMLSGQDIDMDDWLQHARNRWIEPEIYERAPVTAGRIRRLHDIVRDLREE